jgi:hypothetical protein
VRITKRSVTVGGIAALLATNAVLLVVQPGLAISNALPNLLGPNMIRAEVFWQAGGVRHDTRLDRGRIRAVGAGSLTLFERDGTTVIVPVSPTALIELNGRVVVLSQLRRGMRALTVRDGDAPADHVQATRR